MIPTAGGSDPLGSVILGVLCEVGMAAAIKVVNTVGLLFVFVASLLILRFSLSKTSTTQIWEHPLKCYWYSGWAFLVLGSFLQVLGSVLSLIG
jgi:hypothetical protein